MANSGKRKGGRKGRERRDGSYEPVRGARLKRAARQEPAPEPAPVGLEDPSLSGEGVDDGLRILAALETMESLEPDFCDVPEGEASVTIVERAPSFEMYNDDAPALAAAARLSADSSAARKLPRADAERRIAYHGPVEEAAVEILEGPALPPVPTADRQSKKKGRRVTQRYFKALTGDDDA